MVMIPPLPPDIHNSYMHKHKTNTDACSFTSARCSMTLLSHPSHMRGELPFIYPGHNCALSAHMCAPPPPLQHYSFLTLTMESMEGLCRSASHPLASLS